jgi:cytochrome c6
MSKHFSFTLPMFAIGAILSISNVSANDVFDKYCSSCHNNGGNIMNPKKTLSKQDLADNGVNSISSISSLVSSGKTPMPAFGKQLSDKEIASVAKYVLDQAGSGWK